MLEFVDVLWAGALVDRTIVVSVDGRRCLLPVPRRSRSSSTAGNPGPTSSSRPRRRTPSTVARLVDSIGESISEFERYFSEVRHRRTTR